MGQVKVSDLQGDSYDLVQYSQDIDHIAELEANEDIRHYATLIVRAVNGELNEIWGVAGIPYLDYYAYQMK